TDRVPGEGSAGDAAARPVPVVRGPGAGRARPEDRLRALVVARAVHRPRRACARHRRSLGRHAHRAPARRRRTEHRAGAGPGCIALTRPVASRASHARRAHVPTLRHWLRPRPTALLLEAIAGGPLSATGIIDE